MMQIAIFIAFLVVIFPLALAMMRANELFLLRVSEGKVTVRRGKLPQRLLDDIDDVMQTVPSGNGALRQRRGPPAGLRRQRDHTRASTAFTQRDRRMVDGADTTRAPPSAARLRKLTRGNTWRPIGREGNRQAANQKMSLFLGVCWRLGGSSPAFDVTTVGALRYRRPNKWLSCFCARSYLGPLVLVNSSCLRMS